MSNNQTYTLEEMKQRFGEPSLMPKEIKAKVTPRTFTLKEMEEKAEAERLMEIRSEQSLGDKLGIAVTSFKKNLGDFDRGTKKVASYVDEFIKNATLPLFGQHVDSEDYDQYRAVLQGQQDKAEAEHAATEIPKTNPVIDFFADPSLVAGGTT